MAKAQTFGDKLKKKKAEDKPVVKVIKGFKGNDGTVRFVEQFMKVDDINQVDHIDINR
jgi:hypothetical protein